METCFLLKNGCDDIEGEGCWSEGVGKSDRFACFKTEAEATQKPTPSGQTELVGSVTELGELKKCMERGFMALHLEVAPAICNDLRNTVYAVINHLEGNQ